MHFSKILLAAPFATAVLADAAADVEFANVVTKMAQQNPERQLSPIWVSVIARTDIQPPTPFDNDKYSNKPNNVQVAMATPLPQVTMTDYGSPKSESWKYIPEPPEMPTGTPHYPSDMGATLTLGIKSNMAESKSIKVLQEATRSYAVAISSLEAQLKENKNSLKDAEKKVREIKSAADGVVSIRPGYLVITWTSLVATFGLAGLAFIL